MATPYTAPDTLEHGGAILQAAKTSDIPAEQWLDLSTGINPNGWPVPNIPAETWQRLPELEDGLEQAVRQYYSQRLSQNSSQNSSQSYSASPNYDASPNSSPNSSPNYSADNFIVTAGSQSAIQLLPQLFPTGVVWVPEEGYTEHPYWWDFYQHTVFFYKADELENIVNNTPDKLPFDTLLVINPNNPTTQLHPREFLIRLLNLIEKFDKRFIVDEAFLDTRPENSMLRHSKSPHLIILRSLGKFFGLAGIRCGVLFANPTLLKTAKRFLGPWQIATPSRWVATKALTDRNWQTQAIKDLTNSSQRLEELITHFLPPDKIASCSRSDLFCSIVFQNEKEQQLTYAHFLKHGILIRRFSICFRLRIGLPKDDVAWKKLTKALSSINF